MRRKGDFMPQYFFNVRTGPYIVEDHEGSDLADLEAARQEAILDARSAMSTAIQQGRDISRRATIEICDDKGRILMLVPYTDAILPDYFAAFCRAGN
jgi:hypothetical protein